MTQSKEKFETKKLPMMPIRDVVIFPHMMTPFVVGRESSVRALEEALAADKKIFLATQHDASVDEPKPNEIYQVGTIVNIVQSLKLPDGNIKVLVEGIERGKILQISETEGFMEVSVRVARYATETNPVLETAMQRVTTLFEQYVKLCQSLNYETMIAAVRMEDPAKLTDTIAANLQLSIEEKQELLEIFDPAERLNRIGDVLDIEIEKLNMDRTIQSRVKRQMERARFEDVIAAKGYTGLGVLVAFSGAVNDDGDEVTEVGMNGFGEAELPDRFESKDFHILIVAEKYQTGFDQPLLHTMFVDKKLKDLKAVQTLSRLNRTCAGKEDTFVLDFENKAEDIREAFKPYYEQPEIDEPTDPNQLYLLKAQLDAFQFYWGQEVLDFAKVFYKPVAKQAANDQGKLHAAIDPAVQRFTEEPDDHRQEEFRHLLDTYIRLYGFVSQIMPFEDVELERLYSYLRLMRTKLPRREGGGILDLEDDVNLAFYRLTRTFDGSVSLTSGESGVLTGVQDVGTAKPKEDAFSPLSAVITLINDKFGTDFDENDKLFWDQVNNDLAKDDALTQQARTNDLDNFRHAFDPKAINAVLHRSDRNTHTFEQFMADDDMRRMLLSALAAEFHANARRPEG